MAADALGSAECKQREAASKPILLVISQVYVPDPVSVGQHMADAAEELAARGHRVVVLTSACGYENPNIKYPRRELRSGVEIVRLALSSFGKKTIFYRLAGQAIFLLQVIARGLMARRLAGILVSTSPPMASFAALIISFVRGAPITYWLMDFNPDQAIVLGQARPWSPFVKVLRWLNRRVFARAANVIVLDRFMAERVQSQYEVRGRLSIMPPWPHVGVVEELSGSANPFREEHNPDGRFVVMYSGNHSLASPIKTLLEAALEFRDDSRFLFMFIGGGLGKREVDQAIVHHRPANIVSLPYQPLDCLKYSLSAADLHVVTLGNDMVGLIHPCKIYGAMAVGKPILLLGPRPSHASDIIDRHDVGWHVEHGDVKEVVATIRRAEGLAAEARIEMGDRARAAIGEHYGKPSLCEAFCDTVETAFRPALCRVAASLRNRAGSVAYND